jgi:hypothetical protein
VLQCYLYCNHRCSRACTVHYRYILREVAYTDISTLVYNLLLCKYCCSNHVSGDDLRVDLDLDFKTACFGGEERVQIRHLEACNVCTGTGVKPGAKVSTCSQCGGQGVVIQVSTFNFYTTGSTLLLLGYERSSTVFAMLSLAFFLKALVPSSSSSSAAHITLRTVCYRNTDLCTPITVSLRVQAHYLPSCTIYLYHKQIQRTPLGAFQTQVACPGCRGTGQKVEAYCSPCNGQGLIETTKPVKVRIPAGVVSSLQLIEHVSVQFLGIGLLLVVADDVQQFAY